MTAVAIRMDRQQGQAKQAAKHEGTMQLHSDMQKAEIAFAIAQVAKRGI